LKNIKIFVVSDAVSETGELLINAVRYKFADYIQDVYFHPFTDDCSGIDALLNRIDPETSLIVYHYNSQDLENYMIQEAAGRGIITYDVTGSLLQTLSKLTGIQPEKSVDVICKLDEQYFKKVECIEFAVKYDDGKNTNNLYEADIVLIGPSRTSKTPISIYLANKGFRVANIPLMPEVEPPSQLFELPANRIYGLILDPDHLVRIRSERVRAMSLTGNSNYSSMERVLYELEKAKELFDKLGCVVIDATTKAIEEIAAIILTNLLRR
jgi:hypothetical protein